MINREPTTEVLDFFCMPSGDLAGFKKAVDRGYSDFYQRRGIVPPPEPAPYFGRDPFRFRDH